MNRNKRAPIPGNHLPASRAPPDWRSARFDDREIRLAVWRDSPFTDALEEGCTGGAGFPQGCHLSLTVLLSNPHRHPQVHASLKSRSTTLPWYAEEISYPHVVVGSMRWWYDSGWLALWLPFNPIWKT